MELVVYTAEEIRVIRIFCCLFVAVNIFLLLYAMINIRYLMKLEIRRTSINIFYAFIVLGTSFTTISMVI